MLLRCTACTTRYPPDVPICPHCGSTDYTEVGAEMPKIHANRPDTHEPVVDALVGLLDTLDAGADAAPAAEPVEQSRPRRRTRAKAGHAAGSGSAG